MTHWFNVTREGALARVSIFGEIGFGQPVDDLLAGLAGASAAEVILDALGGAAPDALRIYRRLREIDTTVFVHRAFSGGALVALAGRRVRIAEEGAIMLHAPVHYVCGHRDDLRRAIAELDAVRSEFAAAIVRRTKQPIERAEAWLTGDHNNFFNAKRAVELGFADEVVEVRNVAAIPTAPAPTEASGPTEEELAFLQVVRAFGSIPVRDVERFRRNLAVALVGQVQSFP